MTEAYQCDVCEELYEGEPPSRIKTSNTKEGASTITDPYLPSNGRYDLCEECSREFNQWRREGALDAK